MISGKSSLSGWPGISVEDALKFDQLMPMGVESDKGPSSHVAAGPIDAEDCSDGSEWANQASFPKGDRRSCCRPSSVSCGADKGSGISGVSFAVVEVRLIGLTSSVCSMTATKVMLLDVSGEVGMVSDQYRKDFGFESNEREEDLV